MGISLDTNNKLNNLKYGLLNVTGTTYFDANTQTCVQTYQEPYVCCVSTSSYLVGWCPIIDSNHFCVKFDDNHQSGQICIYSSMSFKPQTGQYVKCQKTVCNKTEKLYNMCIVYQFGSKTFYFCSSQKVLNNQKSDIVSPYKSDNYYFDDFSSGQKYYSVDDLPILTKEDVATKRETSNNCWTAFIVLISITGFTVLLGLGGVLISLFK